VGLSLAAVSCGEGESDGNEPAAPTTRVEITLWAQGRNGDQEHAAVLTCDPPGGNHTRPDEACAALARQEAALAPVPGDAICTQIFGGPQEARVFGTVSGREVDAVFSRTNGCEIDRWDKLALLLEISR
jgi:hypothetical protein